MSALTAHRFHFAFTVVYHYLFPQLTMGLALLITGCSSSSSGAPGAQDPSRQAETEYDIARDLWLRRGDPRGALEHALKAAELDDRNAEAMHLVALLYLDFCSRNAAECRLPKAEAAARRAIEVESSFREAKNTLAVILIHEKRPAEAVKIDVRSISRRAPSSPPDTPMPKKWIPLLFKYSKRRLVSV